MNKVLVIFISLYCANTLACKMDLSDIEELKKNPEEGVTFLVGERAGTFFESFFQIKFPYSLKRLTLTDDRCFIPTLSPGYKYVLISRKNLETLKTIELSNLDDLFVELGEAQSIVNKLALKKEVVKGVPNFFWKYCQKDNECVATKNMCNASESVNKKYKPNYDEYVKNGKTSKNCKSSLGAKVKNKCVDYFCE